MLHVRSEDLQEIDLADAGPADPVLGGTPGVRPYGRSLEGQARRGRAQKDARQERRRQHDVGQSDRRVCRSVGYSDLLHVRLIHVHYYAPEGGSVSVPAAGSAAGAGSAGIQPPRRSRARSSSPPASARQRTSPGSNVVRSSTGRALPFRS